MYQHVFWFYSHPAGLHHDAARVRDHLRDPRGQVRKPIFGYRMMAFSLLAILVLGFTVWAHHMFVSGMAPGSEYR